MTTEEQGPEIGPQSEPKQPAPTTAPKVRHAPAPPTVDPALTPSGEALAVLLPNVLENIQLDIGADIDEVVCRIAPERVAEACAALKSDARTSMKFLRLLTVVDYEENDQEFEVVYHLYSLEHQHKMVLKARVPAADPALPTVTTVWRGADWYEREMHDLFGVDFSGHPNLVTLILPDGFEGFPGRKSYELHDYDEW